MSQKILIVDDEKDMYLLIKKSLERDGFEMEDLFPLASISVNSNLLELLRLKRYQKFGS